MGVNESSIKGPVFAVVSGVMFTVATIVNRYVFTEYIPVSISLCR